MQHPITRCRPAISPLRLVTPLALGVLAAAALLLAPPAARAADDAPAVERVQVTDPFIEMHTGPGRGFPVFHVAAREEWIEITLRHTDWFKVRTASGKEGWVPREQLERTLSDSGERKTFRDVLLDDYLARRVEFGSAYGRFHGEPLVKFWTAVRLSDTLSAEATLGQVQGVFSGTDLWHVDLHAEPWSNQRFSPYLGIGLGHFRNLPNLSLVDNKVTSVKLADASVGARYHLSERFVLRADYTIYTAFLSDSRTTDYRAVTAGLSFFF